jgi:hypothetical protein
MSGVATFGFFCGSIVVALVAFYIWVSIHFAYYYRHGECAWDLPGEGYPWLIVATVAVGASLLLIATLLIRNARSTASPMQRQRIIRLALATLLLTGALAFILGGLMGAGMECFD